MKLVKLRVVDLKKVRWGIFLSVVSLVVSLGVGELLLRWFWHPAYLDEQYKKDNLAWMAGNVRLNRWGYRDREFDLKKRTGMLRVYALGDSYTFGWYIDDEQKTYPKVLEKLLGESFGKDKVEVINAGRHGFGLVDSVERFREEGMMMGPDVVVLGINSGDLLGEVPALPITGGGWWGRFRLYNLLVGSWERRNVARVLDEFIKTGYQEGTEKMKKAEGELRDLKRMTDVLGAQLVLVVFPEYDPAKPNEGEQYMEYHVQVAKMANKLGIVLVDLLEPFGEVQDKVELVLDPTDPHPSVLADEIAGRTIFEKVDWQGIFLKPRIRVAFREVMAWEGRWLPGCRKVVEAGAGGVFFNEENGLSVQKLLLPSSDERQVPYLEDVLKTARAFTHEGWPGAKVEHYLMEEGGLLKIPGQIYGFGVVGVSQVTGFWRVNGGLQSEDLGLSNLKIWRDKEGVKLKVLVERKDELYKVVLDVAVKQVDVDQGRAVRLFATERLTRNLEKGERVVEMPVKGEVGSWMKFVREGVKEDEVWVNNVLKRAEVTREEGKLVVRLAEEAKEGDVLELPVAKEVNKARVVVECI